MKIQQKVKVTVLDVRTSSEYSARHLEGAVNIPISELPSRVQEIPNSEDPILIYSDSGVRSGEAEKFLRSNGFSNAYDGGSIDELNSVLNY